MKKSELSRQKIKEAALEEFAAHGISGARVDRIAEKAGCNKNLIYIYFNSKEALFETILQEQLENVYQQIEFTSEHLDQYAQQVFNTSITHIKMIRLLSWYYLDSSEEQRLSNRDETRAKKLEKIRKAQEMGIVTSEFPPEFLLASIMSIAACWTVANPLNPNDYLDSEEKKEATRQYIAEAVRKLIAPAS